MIPIAQSIMEEIRDHAASEYPFECCGVIIGKVDSGAEDILRRCRNIQNALHEKDPETFTRDARTAYYIDPKELMDIFKETEGRVLVVKWFYHSHPDHDAYFSEEDRRMALFDEEPLYPQANYLVISVYDRKIKDEAFFSWDPETRTFPRQN